MKAPLRGLHAAACAVATAAIVAGAAGAAGAAPDAQRSAPVVIHDDRGIAVPFAAPPKRIVSLLPSLTETVCALGACDRLVGVDRFSNWPASVDALPRLGGLDDAQVERIVALKPDVVLVTPHARVIERLATLRVPVLALRSETRAEVRRSMGELARLLGQPRKADEVWTTIDRDLAEAAAQVPPRWRGKRVYVEVDTTPYAAGAASFLGQTLTRLGLVNIAGPELGPFPRLNPEYVVQANPDLVIATAAAVADMPRRPGWSALPAFRHHATCAFPPATYEMMVRPGPRMGEGAKAVVGCLASLRP